MCMKGLVFFFLGFFGSLLLKVKQVEFILLTQSIKSYLFIHHMTFSLIGSVCQHDIEIQSQQLFVLGTCSVFILEYMFKVDAHIRELQGTFIYNQRLWDESLPCLKEWNWCSKADLHLKKKTKKTMGRE